MQLKLISITNPLIEGILTPEDLISYIARVSNPNNQMNTETAPRLLKYLIDHKHWSPFEQVSLTFQIVTSRAIAAQILRHRSFNFQEFSQRYADATLLTEGIPLFELRRQDNKNRQNSIDDVPDEIRNKWDMKIREHFTKAKSIYDGMITDGIAKECARFVLPLAMPTRLYVNGNIRSWITYIGLREKQGTQKEHMIIAKACKKVFSEQFPIITEALGGFDKEWCI